MVPDPSITQILADLGYRHERREDASHAIIHIATGDLIGHHHAGTAIAAAQADAYSRKSKTERLDETCPGWRAMTHPGGERLFADDGTMLDALGNRSIFDDIDE